MQLLQLGRGHTKGDTVAWLPQQKILFSGDLVEFNATPYAGDAYFADWPQTLDRLAALDPAALVPGRGAALTTPYDVAQGLTGTRAFMIGAADWHHDPVHGQGLRVRQLLISTLAAETAMLDAFAQWLAPDTVLCSFNGRSYDAPLLKTRFRLARRPEPIAALEHLDLLHPEVVAGSADLADDEQRRSAWA